MYHAASFHMFKSLPYDPFPPCMQKRLTHMFIYIVLFTRKICNILTYENISYIKFDELAYLIFKTPYFTGHTRKEIVEWNYHHSFKCMNQIRWPCNMTSEILNDSLYFANTSALVTWKTHSNLHMCKNIMKLKSYILNSNALHKRWDSHTICTGVTSLIDIERSFARSRVLVEMVCKITYKYENFFRLKGNDIEALLLPSHQLLSNVIE